MADAPQSPGIPDLLPVVLAFYKNPRGYPALHEGNEPLPNGITPLLTSTGSALAPSHIDDTARTMGSDPEELTEALRFFCKEVFFRAGGDSYRVLGLTRGADSGQLKTHYRALMGLFHPDKDTSGEGWDTVYAPVINAAYAELKPVLAKGGEAPDGAPDYAGADPDASTADPLEPSGVAAPPIKPATGTRRAPPPPILNARRRRKLGTLILLAGLAGVSLALWWLLSDHKTDIVIADSPNSGAPIPLIPPIPDRARPDLASLEAAREAGTDLQQPGPAATGDANGNAKARAAPGSDRSNEMYRTPTTDRDVDRRVEEHVKAQVERATRSVLGRSTAPARAPSRPVAKAAPPPTNTQTTAAPSPRATAPQADDTVALAANTRSAQDRTQDSRDITTTGNLAPQQAAPPVVATAIDNPPSDPGAETPAASPRPEPEIEPEPAPPATKVADTSSIAVPEAVTATAPASSTDLRTEAQVQQIVSSLAEAYLAADAFAFAALFTPGAITPDAAGRDAIYDLYRGFFANNHTERFDYQSLQWRALDDGGYAITTEAVIGTRPKNQRAGQNTPVTINFELVRDNARFLIDKMTY